MIGFAVPHEIPGGATIPSQDDDDFLVLWGWEDRERPQDGGPFETMLGLRSFLHALRQGVDMRDEDPDGWEWLPPSSVLPRERVERAAWRALGRLEHLVEGLDQEPTMGWETSDLTHV